MEHQWLDVEIDLRGNSISFANKYLVKQKELCTSDNDTDNLDKKVVEAFTTFNNYLPYLGILKDVFELIRNDLYEGIYSKLKTSKDYKLKHVPYFVTCQQLSSERDERVEDLENQLEEIQNILDKTLKNLDGEKEKVKVLSDEILTLKSSNSMLCGDIHNLAEEKKRLNEEVKECKKELVNRYKDNKDLQEKAEVDQNHLKEIITNLETYKIDHEKLDVGFQDANLLNVGNGIRSVPSHRSLSAIEMKQLDRKQHVKNIDTLLNQLLTLQKRVMSEYDKHLNERKKKFLHVEKRKFILSTKNDEDDDKTAAQEESKALSIVQKNFLQSIGDIQQELALLNEQKAGIEQEIIELEKLNDKNSAKQQRQQQQQQKNRDQQQDDADNKEKILQDDLVKIMEGEIEDPFIPHQELFNKFSLMIYTSTDSGKLYTEIPGCTYCPSCHEKTLVCLHKVSVHEKVIVLPNKCTNIKITRPKLKHHLKRPKRPKVSTVDKNEELKFRKTVWPWFDSLFVEVPKIMTTWNKEQLLSIIHEFYSYIIWKDEHSNDEHSNDDEAVLSFLDCLVQFFTDRYLCTEIIVQAVYLTLFHTEQYSRRSKEIDLFGRICNGSLHSSMLLYIFLIVDVINTRCIETAEEFERFLKDIYPFFGEDEIEVVKMDFISFCENCVNSASIYQYLLHLVLTEKEPRILEIYTNLHSKSVRMSGYFNDIELSEAIESMTPWHSEKLRKRLMGSSTV